MNDVTPLMNLLSDIVSQSHPSPTLRGAGHDVLRQPAAFRTLFTTEHSFDAGLAGFDGPAEIGVDGGFAVHFDGRGSLPSAVLNGSDGEVMITGLAAIKQARIALQLAEAMAERMELRS